MSASNSYDGLDAIKKADFLKSVILLLSALIRLANRYADLAEVMAAR